MDLVHIMLASIIIATFLTTFFVVGIIFAIKYQERRASRSHPKFTRFDYPDQRLRNYLGK